jgi:16S rRNA (cytosine1402-N4)-methyltransferase
MRRSAGLEPRTRPPTRALGNLPVPWAVKKSVRKQHVPVLLSEVLEVLDPRPGQVIVDCTVGCAGHSVAILQRLAPRLGGGRLIGLDLDASNLAIAHQRLSCVGGRFDLFHANFAALPGVLARAGVEGGRVDAVLADIGVSSTQIDDPERGFSYRRPGALDMRMDPANFDK